MRISIILLLTILSSCAGLKNQKGSVSTINIEPVTRTPSSSVESGCADLLAQNLRLGHNLRPADWQKGALVERGIVDSEEFELIKSSKYWESIIKENGSKTEDEQSMAITILAILKKKYPAADQINLKERFSVLMQYCI